MLYNSYRDYDPSTGRYLEVDPVGLMCGANLYAYVANRPTVSSDRLGLFDPFTSFGDFAGEAYSAIRQINRNINELLDANTPAADKYFHCKAHCEACVEGPGGEAVSCVGGLTHEIRNLGAEAYNGREMIGSLGAFSDSQNDMRANASGRHAAAYGAHWATYEPVTDRIAQATGANPKSYAHDVYGSRIWAGSSTYAGLPSQVYNELNRLVDVRNPINQAVLGQYAYDAFGPADGHLT